MACVNSSKDLDRAPKWVERWAWKTTVVNGRVHEHTSSQGGQLELPGRGSLEDNHRLVRERGQGGRRLFIQSRKREQ